MAPPIFQQISLTTAHASSDTVALTGDEFCPVRGRACGRLNIPADRSVLSAVHMGAKGKSVLDYDPLEGYRDAPGYDVEDGGYDADYPLTAQLARELGGPLLDLACGTGTMAIRLAAQGYRVTGVDIVPEMVEWASQKAAKQDISIEWVVADARTFRLQEQFPFIYMLGNAFQHFLTRADQEALLARVREHLHAEGCFLFGTRNPSPRNLFEARYPAPKTYTRPDGTQYVATEQQVYDPIAQIQHYTFHDRWLNPEGRPEEKTTRTALRYVFPQEMEALLFYNGFQIRACYGSWQQEPLTATSREMIYMCQRRV